MADELVSALSSDGLLRARYISSTEVCAEANRRHQPDHIAKIALNRAITSVVLIPMSWKDADRVCVQWLGQGPLGALVAEARSGGKVRGYPTRPHALAPPLFQKKGRPGPLGLRPGGHLSVLKQSIGGSFTQGQSDLRLGGVDDDLERWFWESEQIPTRLHVRQAGDEVSGLLVQVVPGQGGVQTHKERLIPLSDELLVSEEHALTGVLGENYKITEREEIRFECLCSYDRAAGGVLMFSEDELLTMVAEDQGAETSCSFCAEVYRFTAEDLCNMIDAKRSQRGEL